ncbi:SWI/SNF-related matrix-associated actin-dependent regulator of chromatin subfamily A-like protein [Quillaja saponaria]|uniref:SWI/SNF-related matrix-associated actin-dependent regulator of chromatin subfamily A-like protein n=1 Tax=Quillaja saponaria TaxID=32244 RepID=A0AAD7KR63_QUISA|nr:SWI/SNF-related matrix-associated actin-dependent regulator of chromatin subfamily A-like protein [Quillaja saponaria]
MGSHRKVHSQGSIPFSWEDKPGVSKASSYQIEHPIEIGRTLTLNALALKSLSPSSPARPPRPPPESHAANSERTTVAAWDTKIPLPPCPLQPPRRSISGKGFKWQEDPFLVAYKECTKSEKNSNKSTCDQNKKGVPNSKPRRRLINKSIFSCKTSCEIRDDNFLKLSQLPPLPRDRGRVLR